MSDVFLKKFELSIEDALKRKNPNINLELLISHINQKINTNSSNEEMMTALENIIIVNT